MSDSAKPKPPVHIPTFALTLDTELVWGSFDHTTAEDFERAYPDVRGTIAAIVGLLERYEVPATWAVVGHLFLDACERGPEGLAHPELPRPQQSHWPPDWYSSDPCTDRSRDPLWYGTDVLDMIQGATVAHEVACHSFGHADFGEGGLSLEGASADIAACVDLARKRGLELRSFVFPRNREGSHEMLRQHGFRAFRGKDPISGASLPRPLRRALHLGDEIAGMAPPVSRPMQELPGLWNIPGSMLLMSRLGMRKAITRIARKRKASAGLARARSSGGVFHLWTHPFNLASDPAFLLDVLEDVLREAVAMRDRGELAIETMGDIAERMAGPVGEPEGEPL